MPYDPSAQPDLERYEHINPPTPGPAPSGVQDNPPAPNPYLRSPLPPSQVLQPDILRQFYTTGYPQGRILPLQANASAGSNAAIQSVSTNVTNEIINNLPSGGGGGGSTDTFVYAGPEFSVSPGPNFVMTKNPEPPDTFFRAAVPGLTSLTQIATNNGASGGGSQTTLTFSPSVVPGWVYYLEANLSQSNHNIPGWVAWGNGSALTFAALGSITATDTSSSALAWCNAAILFSGTIPTFISATSFVPSQSGGSIGVGTVGVTNIASDTIIVGFHGSPGVVGVLGFAVSDTNGNTYTPIITNHSSTTGGNTAVMAIFIATGVGGGSNTITGTVSGLNNNSGTFGTTVDVVEIGPLTSGSGLPFFGAINSADIPGINAGKITSGLLDVSIGGTGANLSGSGGANQIVKQISAGAAFTVGTLAASGLSNGTTGTGAVVLASAPTLTTPQWTATTVAALPAGAEGQHAYATNGRKVGEGAGSGTGVPVYFSSASWRVFSTDAPVAA